MATVDVNDLFLLDKIVNNSTSWLWKIIKIIKNIKSIKLLKVLIVLKILKY